MKYVCPLIVVDDIKAARHFYELLLDQRVESDYGENVVFEGSFSIHHKEHFASLVSVERPVTVSKRSNSFELYFETDDLLKVSAKLKQEGIEFVHDVYAQPWGQRLMRVYDYDGHIVEIGESMKDVVKRMHAEGMSVEEITAKCSMPMQFVEKVIGDNE